MPKSLTFCPNCAYDGYGSENGKEFKCDRCGLVYFQNTAAAVAVMLAFEDEILTAVRKFDPGKGLLDLPGGFIDPLETAEQAVAREVHEELGFKLTAPLKYLASFPNEYRFKEITYFTLDLFFIAELAERPAVEPADDVAAVQWQSQSALQLEDFAFDSMKRGLRCYMNHVNTHV